MPRPPDGLGLVGVLGFPRNREELERLFPSEAACADFVARLRWANGFECPHCGYRGPVGTNVRGQHPCRGCRRQVSVLAGTVFEGTRTPLRAWFEIAWDLVSSQSRGTAVALRERAGIATHKTAWTIAHKLRRCLGMPGDERLAGRVEVDDSVLLGVHGPINGPDSTHEHRILVAVELAGAADAYRGTPRLGRCHMRRADVVNSDIVREFILSTIAEGSEVVTDRSEAFAEVMAAWADDPRSEPRYRWSSFTLGGGATELPNVHRIVVDARRWLLETFQGAIRSNHLDFYLDEWVFRFNRRGTKGDALLFRDLLLAAVQMPPIGSRGIVRSFPARLIPLVVHHLADHGIHVTVAGGWAADGLLHRATRIHSDLDLLVPRQQLETARHMLAELVLRDQSGDVTKVPGWSVTIYHGGPQLTLERPIDGTRIDLHPMDPVGHQGWREILPAPPIAATDEALPPPPNTPVRFPALAAQRRSQLRPVMRKYPVRRPPARPPQPTLVFTYEASDLRGVGVYSEAACDTLSEDAQRRRRQGYPSRDEDRHDLLVLARLS